MESKAAARICVPVCEASLSNLPAAMDHAAMVADFVELRLDCLDPTELDYFDPETLTQTPKPVILTLRSPDQGGHNRLTETQRLEFWTRWLKHSHDAFLDIESELLPLIGTASELDCSRVIVSQHDFAGVPDDLVAIYQTMAASPAAIGKIAVTANDVVDCLPIFDLLDRARAGDKKLIAIAMGSAGVMTRILGPSRGGFLTYAALTEDSGTAPGQTTADDLRSVYHIDTIDTDTFICGIIGMPVMHSVSPHMHNAALVAHGLNGVYLPLEVRSVESFFRRMVRPQTREFDWNLKGLSVTAPHKSAVLKYLDEIDEKAMNIGA
ncbi:MAG TPA: type I 3-dehydroquinate dehydratase, partial [Pyrinomonadaceae bacterium]|nr:type I 3-dehydroquinate dehydratase [Pyrinomonadaceae bacterium]